MGVQKKTRKFATVKRVISQRDDRLKKNQPKPLDQQKKKNGGKDELVRSMYVLVYLLCFSEITTNEH